MHWIDSQFNGWQSKTISLSCGTFQSKCYCFILSIQERIHLKWRNSIVVLPKSILLPNETWWGSNSIPRNIQRNQWYSLKEKQKWTIICIPACINICLKKTNLLFLVQRHYHFLKVLMSRILFYDLVWFKCIVLFIIFI